MKHTPALYRAHTTWHLLTVCCNLVQRSPREEKDCHHTDVAPTDLRAKLTSQEHCSLSLWKRAQPLWQLARSEWKPSERGASSKRRTQRPDRDRPQQASSSPGTTWLLTAWAHGCGLDLDGWGCAVFWPRLQVPVLCPVLIKMLDYNNYKPKRIWNESEVQGRMGSVLIISSQGSSCKWFQKQKNVKENMQIVHCVYLGL